MYKMFNKRPRIQQAAYKARPAELASRREEDKRYIENLDKVFDLLNKKGTQVKLKEITLIGRKYIVQNGNVSKEVHVTHSDIMIRSFIEDKYADFVVVFGEVAAVKEKMALLQYNLAQIAPRYKRNIHICGR